MKERKVKEREVIEYTVRVYANGTKYWHQKNRLHCEHGPAIEYANGSKAWYLDGKKLTKEEWENILKCPRCGWL